VSLILRSATQRRVSKDEAGRRAHPRARRSYLCPLPLAGEGSRSIGNYKEWERGAPSHNRVCCESLNALSLKGRGHNDMRRVRLSQSPRPKAPEHASARPSEDLGLDRSGNPAGLVNLSAATTLAYE
jgi:hypothetical protein